jgi:hypothetical protein
MAERPMMSGTTTPIMLAGLPSISTVKAHSESSSDSRSPSSGVLKPEATTSATSSARRRGAMSSAWVLVAGSMVITLGCLPP